MKFFVVVTPFKKIRLEMSLYEAAPKKEVKPWLLHS